MDGRHQGRRGLTGGEPLAHARAVLLMLHGRGASAEDILSRAGELAPPGLRYLAPQAAGYSWCPNSFLAPLASNEPYLSSALALVDTVLAQIAAAGIPLERTMLLGFSQGACLGLEYVARHARRYGGVVGWSGGLIGPDGTPRDYQGTLAGIPVFLGCSDGDPHVPQARVGPSRGALRGAGGGVTERVYPHTRDTVRSGGIALECGV